MELTKTQLDILKSIRFGTFNLESLSREGPREEYFGLINQKFLASEPPYTEPWLTPQGLKALSVIKLRNINTYQVREARIINSDDGQLVIFEGEGHYFSWPLSDWRKEEKCPTCGRSH